MMTFHKSVLVCMQHALSSEQVADLAFAESVSHLREVNPDLFAKLANIPVDIAPRDLRMLAHKLCDVMWTYKQVILPIGSPEFQATLLHVATLRASHVQESIPALVFARSERVSIDEQQEDGTVLKKSVFKHAGWGEVVL